MEQINTIIIHERQMLGEALQRELQAIQKDSNFSMYHNEMADYYDHMIQTIDSIVNFQGHNDEDFIIYFANMPVSKKQLKDLTLLRNHPLYKKAMGEIQLLQKKQIETALDFPITNEGISVYERGKELKAVKIPQELAIEGNDLRERLISFYQDGSISKRQFEQFSTSLFYIYNYYVSIAMGEQLPYEPISDDDYSQMDRLAHLRHISFHTQKQQFLQARRYQFEDLQNAQENHYIEGRKSI